MLATNALADGEAVWAAARRRPLAFAATVIQTLPALVLREVVEVWGQTRLTFDSRY
jgi:hypothetical protein